jgi:hypothetical protein
MESGSTSIVQLGLANSRMKDFFDLGVLARQFPFDGSTLVRAVRATFARRRTPLPVAIPIALTPEFATDRTKATQWRAFLSKTGATPETESLAATATQIATFVVPASPPHDPTRHGTQDGRPGVLGSWPDADSSPTTRPPSVAPATNSPSNRPGVSP